MRTISLAILLLVLTAATSAEAIKFCLEHTGEFIDNNLAGEDLWLTDIARAPRGQYVYVRDAGNSIIFQDHLGDGLGAGDPGIGCTTDIALGTYNQTYEFELWSHGFVNGNYLRSYEEGGGTYAVVIDTEAITTGNGTHVVDIDAGSPGDAAYDIFNVYNAGAYALYRHGGGLSGELFPFQYITTGSSRYNPPGENIYIYIRDVSTDLKFFIVHMLGWRMGDVVTEGEMIDAKDFSLADGTCPAENTSGDHSMRSEEHQGGAALAGFSHFYSADTWNDHDDLDCWLLYWFQVGTDADPEVDCETANTDFPLRRHETDCGSTNDHGVELDWLRALWDVHTDGTAPDPSFTSMMGWLRDASAWDETDVYDMLDEQADDEGGDLDSNWDVAAPGDGGGAGGNGIDH